MKEIREDQLDIQSKQWRSCTETAGK